MLLLPHPLVSRIDLVTAGLICSTGLQHSSQGLYRPEVFRRAEDHNPAVNEIFNQFGDYKCAGTRQNALMH